MRFFGECPFCIEEYPDGQEFDRTRTVSGDGEQVFSTETCFACQNCGIAFVVYNDGDDESSEPELLENLKIKEVV